MEFIVGAAVIIVLLLFLGVSPSVIVFGILILAGLFCLLMTLFFIGSVILLLRARRVEAKFLRLVKGEIAGQNAVYEVDGEECVNSFPAEVIFHRRIYQERVVRARMLRTKKHRFLFDWYSQIIIAVGLPASVLLTAVMVLLIYGWAFYLLAGMQSI